MLSYTTHMSNIISLGSEIRQLRKNSGQTLFKVAESIGTTRSHLNKIELGRSRPSEKLLNTILAYFSVAADKAGRLMQLAGHRSNKVVTNFSGKEVGNMKEPTSVEQQSKNVNIVIDPNTRQVLYSESVFIHSSDYGLTMDFAQRVGPSDQQFVVARIGMSFDHAKKMLEVLSDHLQKHER